MNDYQKTLSWVVGVLVLIGSIYYQKLAPLPQPAIIGMDLGTTHSVVGIFRNGIGGVKIIQDQRNKTLVPSVVAFLENNKTVVGYEALEYAKTHPKRTIFDVKRFIGKKFDEIQDFSFFPYTIVNISGYPEIEIPGSNSGEPSRRFKPEEISALVLKELLDRAEKFTGRKIKGVVLAIPVEFTEGQKEATKKAAQLVGIEVMRMITEPTASAIAYGLQERGSINTILVFDFGGGTLDCSILNIVSNVFEVVTTSGDDHLGGEDFNVALVDYYQGVLSQRHPESLWKTEAILQRLREQVEKVKCKLSYSLEERITIINEEGSKKVTILDEILTRLFPSNF